MTIQKTKIFYSLLSLFMLFHVTANAAYQSLSVKNSTENYEVSIKSVNVAYGLNEAKTESGPEDLQHIKKGETRTHAFGAFQWISYDPASELTSQHRFMPFEATVVFKDLKTGKETEPQSIGSINPQSTTTDMASTTPIKIINNISMSYIIHPTNYTRGFNWNSFTLIFTEQ